MPTRLQARVQDVQARVQDIQARVQDGRWGGGAKICKNLQNLQNVQNMQSALMHSKRGAYSTSTCLPSPFSRFNLFMSDAPLLPRVCTALKNWGLQALQQSPLVRICSSQTQFETNMQFLRICSSQTQAEINLQDSDVVTGWFA